MKLKRLRLAGYRGFQELDITLESDMTVIAGVNGVGKSSILAAISQIYSRLLPKLSPSRTRAVPVSDDDILVSTYQAQVEAEFVIKNREWTALLTKRRGQSARLNSIYPSETIYVPQTRNILDLKRDARRILQALGSTDEVSQAPLAVFFSPKRQLPDRPRSLGRLETQGIAKAYRGALNDREVELREFMHWFRTQEILTAERPSDSSRVLDSLRKVVTRLIPEFVNLRIEEEPRLGFIVDKRDVDTGEVKALYLHQLSDGERGLLALVFDLARRLAITNPKTRDPIHDGVALVMVDEIELHLHPKWQKNALPSLVAAFPNCQFLITTHSPFVIQSIRQGQLRRLGTPDEELGEYSNQPIEDIAEFIQEVEVPQQSLMATELDKVAEEYFRLLSSPDVGADELQRAEVNYRRIAKRYSANPGLSAILELEALVKKKKDVE
ncbi:MAG: AAA family ATPase [Candidatus Thiodiazotropha lotti]|nr:AAA family ATPase [Candidatus Thiodiazotropha lotti]MCW4187855.1 AAA family ATPase [Candidatus Thiodiazotropha lotti]